MKGIKCYHDHYVSRELFKVRHRRWSETWVAIFRVLICSKCNASIENLCLYQNK